ncbi:MAG: YgiQ family radical SAM protein [Oscillospiraceae bacterium]|jgi:uncharacterized radical SAM protein YgiQ|nr:YgiQ family radical SAM protein [Oscillospiraceae bacterium]
MITLDRSAPCDVLLVTGDAWVDHPSFGGAVIAHVLNALGLNVGVLAQPRWDSERDFLAFPKPRLAVMVTGGNLDSMVAHYTAAKKKRNRDFYTPGGETGRRPDRAVTVYSRLARAAFPDTPLILGGLEASLRRFAHYDYWADEVYPPILADTGADALVYGMGERAVREIIGRLEKGAELDGIRGICVVRPLAALTQREKSGAGALCPSFEECRKSKKKYMEATLLQYAEHDAVRGKTIIQPFGDSALVCYPPAPPLTTAELDEVAAFPFTRRADASYTQDVPAVEEVRFSIIHNRGCFGSCRFCSLAFHQGRMISARSHDSVLKEAGVITKMPDFKGYIHDVGGPTANFRHNACKEQEKRGACRNRSCLTPKPCERLDASHGDYLTLLRKLRAVPGVKKAFIRSGIRFDYLLLDKKPDCFREIVSHHISGQLKVAPEHCSNAVLRRMNKPDWEVFERFSRLYDDLNKKAGKKQFLVPYLISSHPGATLDDAIDMALTLLRTRRQPEQVQDFYPTPGTLSTCMYYTGLDPDTQKPLFVAKTPGDKAMQRALLQWRNPKNKPLVLAALRKAGRGELINAFYPPPRTSKRDARETPKHSKGRKRRHD